ncbi:BMC domain-containing protein [Paenibacillus tianjinensis]|uniref:BMC domain-containing protein n=1 Tax=Paenibacillus tianjinensis TaxID=2810347 RepID=A0ABX7L894_9BACL|nr:BMC domain-containing protein [Paenibacillus tianjinensis]QSF44430.1 BMC domain-containing protein [Paenibacillus tianjinensis]
MQALGLIETLGFTTAVSAADAALKAADVQLVAVEKVIGVGGSLGVTLHFSGDVAAVTSSVEAGKAEAQRVGTVVSAHVIAKAHSDVTGKILDHYLLPENRSEAGADVSTPPPHQSYATTAKPPKSADLAQASDSPDLPDQPN